ncbi:hypothetical protein CAOG_07440 [Capsaspora owczarzaki ATCC 30864]|uniref:Alpha-1,6-mannosyl-glycoprotein 2-beta-N-acetylglucosaminyltransferase n=1 Tax=Capsaspora owczarzaki (strain ATCC 30864) TaxID=595528 RepID=A0A0D2W0B7_CAPO3|nr:hypothetical protein CAOG_07440 [Capsaspora owczarzaki ATCC 30864]KJE97612.1 hypothetical protein CAOG_007440 [Capsaspora owczarzaki ATCC 30864]|eukprot:XP_004343299.1 hypothetical protein CAOG_07440 [Capsaspora owczarzaki ATCC 30864]
MRLCFSQVRRNQRLAAALALLLLGAVGLTALRQQQHQRVQGQVGQHSQLPQEQEQGPDALLRLHPELQDQHHQQPNQQQQQQQQLQRQAQLNAHPERNPLLNLNPQQQPKQQQPELTHPQQHAQDAPAMGKVSESGQSIHSAQDYADQVAPESIVAALRAKVAQMNSNIVVQNNNDARLPALKPNFPVIVIQIHNRLLYFMHTIQSLAQVENIGSALIVLSHDFWDEPIMDYIRSNLKFCRYVQIFMPHSMQLHPEAFPGQGTNDCPRDLSKSDARALGCVNAEFPDTYGHYREAPFAMIKHHWWWKANTVFDVLQVTRENNGPMLFLEEDHVLAPDALVAVMAATAARPRLCPSCQLVGIATYNPLEATIDHKAATAHTAAWLSAQNNMGMVIDRAAWSSIKSCHRDFCTFDDYNWDWSLQYAASTCVGSLNILVLDHPRVVHIGTCGAHAYQHSPGKPCNPAQLMDQLNALWNYKKSSMLHFAADGTPSESISLSSKGAMAVPRPSPNGGWGDHRDHALCIAQVRA